MDAQKDGLVSVPEIANKKNNSTIEQLRINLGLAPSKTISNLADEYRAKADESLSDFLNSRSDDIDQQKVKVENDLKKEKLSAKDFIESLPYRERSKLKALRIKHGLKLVFHGVFNPLNTIDLYLENLVANGYSLSNKDLEEINYDGNKASHRWYQEVKKRKINEVFNFFREALDDLSSGKLGQKDDYRNISICDSRLGSLGIDLNLSRIIFRDKGEELSEQRKMLRGIASVSSEYFSKTKLIYDEYSFFNSSRFPANRDAEDQLRIFHEIISFFNESEPSDGLLEAMKCLNEIEAVLKISEKSPTKFYKTENPWAQRASIKEINDNAQFIIDQHTIINHLLVVNDSYFTNNHSKIEIFSFFEKVGPERVSQIASLVNRGVVFDSWFFNIKRLSEEEDSESLFQSVDYMEALISSLEDDHDLFSQIQLIFDIYTRPLSADEGCLSIDRVNELRTLVEQSNDDRAMLLNLYALSQIIFSSEEERRNFVEESVHVNFSSKSLKLFFPKFIKSIKEWRDDNQDDGNRYGNEIDLLLLIGSPQNEHLLEFIMINFDDIDNYFKDGRYTDLLLEEYIEYISESPKLESYSRENIIFNFAQHLSSDNSPESLSHFFSIMEDLDDTSIYRTLLEQEKLLSKEMLNDLRKLGDKKHLIITYLVKENVRLSFFYSIMDEDFIDSVEEDQKKFWKVISETAHLWSGESEFLFHSNVEIDDFYQNGYATPLFYKQFFEHKLEKGAELITGWDLWSLRSYGDNLQATAKTSEMENQLKNYTKEEAHFWSLFIEVDHFSRAALLNNQEAFFNTLNKDGDPSDSTMIFLASLQATDAQKEAMKKSFFWSMDKDTQNFWFDWRDASEIEKKFINRRISTDHQLDQDLLREAKEFKKLLDSLSESPSKELNKIKEEVAMLLIDSENPEDYLEQIKSIFERNNLPKIIKHFHIFRILYFTKNDQGQTKFEKLVDQFENPADWHESMYIGPTLSSVSPPMALAIMYRTLMKVAIESGDDSLFNYLTLLQNSRSLLDRADKDDELTDDDQEKLSYIIGKLAILMETNTSFKYKKSESLHKNIVNLKRSMKISEQESLIDGLEKNFLRLLRGLPLDNISIDGLIEYSSEKKKEASRRNIDIAVNNEYFPLEKGDLLKAVKSEIIGYLLLQGVVSREFIGVSADSDRTPFDSDFAIVQNSIEAGFQSIINGSIANPSSNYGNTVLIIKDRGQFYRSDLEDGEELSSSRLDFSDYELFESGVLGSSHFGVTVGVSNLEISGILISQEVSEIQREKIIFESANSGLDIPVVDINGNFIAGGESFGEHKLDSKEIQAELDSPHFSPDRFLDILKKVPYIKSLLDYEVGGYKIDEHTIKVMDRFEKQFLRNFNFDSMTAKDFRCLLTLHDIGKRIAFEVSGSTESQHEHTMMILPFIYSSMGISADKVPLISAIIDQDILGDYLFKENISAKEAADEISSLAASVHITKKETLEILKAFYICDGSAYANLSDEGGGGKVFKIDSYNSENVVFEDQSLVKLQQLENLVFEK